MISLPSRQERRSAPIIAHLELLPQQQRRRLAPVVPRWRIRTAMPSFDGRLVAGQLSQTMIPRRRRLQHRVLGTQEGVRRGEGGRGRRCSIPVHILSVSLLLLLLVTPHCLRVTGFGRLFLVSILPVCVHVHFQIGREPPLHIPCNRVKPTCIDSRASNQSERESRTCVYAEAGCRLNEACVI